MPALNTRDNERTRSEPELFFCRDLVSKQFLSDFQTTLTPLHSNSQILLFIIQRDSLVKIMKDVSKFDFLPLCVLALNLFASKSGRSFDIISSICSSFT